MNKKKFIERRPNYFSGFEDGEYEVETFDEVLEIPFVKGFSENKNFYSYAVSVNIDNNLSRDDENYYRMDLMVMNDWDDEYNGCKGWWVIGHLPGFIMYETKLKKWEDIKASHKPKCWTRKYNGCKDLLGVDRDKETQMKILKELGWERDDRLGIASHCDCGWNKNN
jgi:hypothetical protein